MKTCRKCKREKPLSDFYAQSGRCKVCHREDARLYRLANLEHALLAQAQRHRANPQLQAARSRRWYEKNSALAKKRAAAFDRAHPERRREITQRRRARLRGATVERVDYVLVRQRDEDVCYLCGELVLACEMDFDHVVPIARGGSHSYGNVRVTHAFCNRRKGARLPEECSWAVNAPAVAA